MRPGPFIRRMFGPYEHAITEAYRRIFVDLDDLARLIREWTPVPQRILEVGCGEGAMTERLVRSFPATAITAIDIAPNIGRLFIGPRSNVTFRQVTAKRIAEHSPSSFDVVLLADVMHHVPHGERGCLLDDIKHAMTPDGKLVFKDWLISLSPIHWLCGGSDRYLTGDSVSYFTMEEAESLLISSFGEGAIRARSRVRPWQNNFAFLLNK